MVTWRARGGLVVMFALVSGCALQSQVPHVQAAPLADTDICRDLASALTTANVGWPIAQNPSELRKSSLDQVRTAFDGASRRSATDLGGQLKNWVITLDKEIPFLLTNDEAGFIQSVSPAEQQRFIEANIEITNTCQW